MSWFVLSVSGAAAVKPIDSPNQTIDLTLQGVDDDAALPGVGDAISTALFAWSRCTMRSLQTRTMSTHQPVNWIESGMMIDTRNCHA